MSTKIRLKRKGRKKRPFYEIIVIDSSRRRDGRPLEDLGWYDPLSKKAFLEFERIAYWRSVGAVPSERVNSLLKIHKPLTQESK